MSFSSDLRRFGLVVQGRTRDVFHGTVTETTRSIVEGSEITGAAGQPVDTGNLRASWHTSFPGPNVAEITTNVDYALHVEENIRGVTFRNHGPHSVKTTIAGFQRIVSHVTTQVAGR